MIPFRFYFYFFNYYVNIKLMDTRIFMYDTNFYIKNIFKLFNLVRECNVLITGCNMWINGQCFPVKENRPSSSFTSVTQISANITASFPHAREDWSPWPRPPTQHRSQCGGGENSSISRTKCVAMLRKLNPKYTFPDKKNWHTLACL